MEVFAFNENAVGYEDLRPEPQLRSFNDINLEIPRSAIAGVAGIVVATAVVGSAPSAQAIVRTGDACPAVGDVQTALNARGFNAGAVDSNFGPQTANAVRSFQAFNGLATDGVVGPATASALGLGNVTCVGAGGGQEVSGTVTASSLTVRTGAGLRFGSVGNFSSGTTVSYDPTSRTNSDGFTWVRVTDGIYSGRWVAESFLGDGPGGGGGQETTTTATANVTASTLTVRSGAGLGFDSVGSYSSGTAVSYDPTSRTNRDGYTWVRVNSGIYSGRWVAESFLGSAGGGGTSASGAGIVSTSSGSGVVVRSGPGTGFASIGSLADGSQISYDVTSSTSSNGFNWVRITSGIYTGRFVARDFLR